MSNVLPSEAKKELMRGLRSRFIFAGALVALIAAIIASLALLPALISIRVAQSSVREFEGGNTAAVKEDQEKSMRAQVLYEGLKSFMSASSTPSEIVALALEKKPSDLKITGITYSRGSLVLNGVSTSREAVNEYREALASDNHFSKVTVPVAALVGAQEGRFSVTLNGPF